MRVSAVFMSHYHGSLLYDENCMHEDAYHAIACDGSVNLKMCMDGMERINRESDYTENLGSRARVVLTGKMIGWNGYGYGHLGAFRQRFEVSEVEYVSKVADGIPWPGDVEAGPGVFRSQVRELERADDRVMNAFVAGNAKMLADVLPHDFEFLTSDGDIITKTDLLKRLKQFCESDKYSYSSRKIHASRGIGYVQGHFGCGLPQDGVQQVYHYANVFVRIGGEWRPVLGQCDGIVP